MIQEKLSSLNLPDLLTFNDGTPVRTASDWPKRRAEILQMILNEEYGVIPHIPLEITCKEADIKKDYPDAAKLSFAGKAVCRIFEIHIRGELGEASFPFYLVYPNTEKPAPVFIHIAFSRPPHNHLPLEEIIDRGFAVVNLYYNDVTRDENEFESGIAKLFDAHTGNRPGKIAMWAWSISRVLDELEKLDCVDTKNAAVCGHSRLGKTSLLCGALDKRFKYVFPNNSGCSGTSLSRDKRGETVHIIQNNLPYWFCNNFKKYSGDVEEDFFEKLDKIFNSSDGGNQKFTDHRFEDQIPFDQHFLTALVAPRYLCPGGAVEDIWADPESEYLCMCETDRVYKLLGLPGFIHPDRMIEPGDVFHEGTIGLHMRPYGHYLSRYDWNRYMDFIQSHP